MRVGQPKTANFYILHEGLLGVLGGALQEVKYKHLMDEEQSKTTPSTGGWLGITDKYWAVALIPGRARGDRWILPPQYGGRQRQFPGGFHPQGRRDGSGKRQGKLRAPGVRRSKGGAARQFLPRPAEHRAVRPADRLGLVLFLTKPLFWLLELFYKLVGNFGLAILIVTVLVKSVFFPLANKSYESMSKMKKLQPEMERLKQLYPDDRMKQQQEMMELYKREKVSPLSGCLPIVIQIPVFFALYKVLFVTIEMRHAPFFGWIRDLSAPDPTTLFNLFGLIPWHPPALLMVGIWPIIMGITMWMQMRLNPTPPDPVQATLFNWMPLIFTFMLAKFPAGLVIYWAWNNLAVDLQQTLIMKRQGVKVDFLGNVQIQPAVPQPTAELGLPAAMAESGEDARTPRSRAQALRKAR